MLKTCGVTHKNMINLSNFGFDHTPSSVFCGENFPGKQSSDYLVVVFPTPPLPPTNTHFNEVCSITLRKEGSNSSASSILTCTSGVIIFDNLFAKRIFYCHIVPGTIRPPTCVKLFRLKIIPEILFNHAK